MKIAFNPSTVAALTTPPNNKDITFDLRGHSIFARGVEFKGTDTNTWRPVVDNLTSDSTTSSLSAKQGKVLKSLIDGKSNSGHTHDDRYLKLTGGTMASNALITFADSGSWGTDKGPQGARGGLHWTGQSDYAKLYAEETVGDNLDLVIQFGDDNSNGLSIRNKANTQTSYISSSGVITTGTFKGNLDWSYITNKPSSYTPSAHTHAWNSLTHSSTTENQAILTNGKANGWKLQTLNIARWDNAANNAHSHANKSVLDGITSALVNSWNTAYNFVSNITGTDTDKVINKWEEIVNFLAGITEDNKLNTLLNSKLSVYELADKTNVGTIKNNGIYYSTTDASSSTLTNSPFNNGFALINMTSYDGGDDLRRSRLAFNAYGEIKVSDDRGQSNTAETWYNVLTSKNSGISGSTIKLNGTSITVYSSGTADGRYVKKSGDTMQGVLTIDTPNFGALTIKRNDDAYGASIQFRGKSSVYGYIGLNNSTKDKQFLRWSSDSSRIYTILDTSSTYISNGKGVINGTEITQVNNADKVDNRHAISTTPDTGIIYKAAIYTRYSLTSYWVRLASIPSISQNHEFVATIHVQSGHSYPGRSAILLVYLRGDASSFMSKSFKICCNSNYDPNRFRLYYKDSDKTSEIWYQNTGQWDGIITTVISQSSEGSLYEGLTLYSGIITAVQTPSVSTYLSAQVSTITDNISGNASTATKLQTARSIWGQSFDGTSNVNGTLSEVGNINFKVDNSYDIGSNAAASRYIYTHWLGAKSGSKLELGANDSGFGQGLCIDTNLNVGIGTNSPAYKLHVNGTFRATNSTVSDLFVNTGDATLKIYTGITADAQNDGNICFQTSIDATDGQSHAYPTEFQNRCNIVLQPRGGQVYIGTNPGIGNTTYKLYVNSKIFSNGGFVKNGSSDSYVLLGGGGHKLESSLNVAYSKYLTGIAITGGNNNNAGYRLIFEKTMGGWDINYGVWAIAFRHSGRGTLNIGFDTTNKDSSTYSYDIRFLGSIVSIEHSPFRAFFNSTTKVFRIYWHYVDYTSGAIAVLRGNMEPHNGTWMTSLPNDVGTELTITYNMADQAVNADTVDGEHASSFVRAGHYESNDLNKLDTYSFIRSVNSNVSSTSPKGNTGWYNVIQLVHKNGVSDGPSYIGQIALGMTTNTNDMFFRGKRTDPWKTVIHSGNYTEFINNYYWANVKISTSSSTTTSPTVHTLTATRVCAGHNPGIDNSISCSNWFRSSGNTGWYNTTYQGGWYMSDTSWIRAHNGVGIYTSGQIYSSSSIRMSNILLEYTNEINNSANGSIHLNYRNSGNVSLCYGGGTVGIGTTTPSYKLDVNGQMRASGFHHASVNSDNYMLLAGGGYKSFGGDYSAPIFLGYLDLYCGNDGTISSFFYCLGYTVQFTYTRGGNYCKIVIPDTTRLSFYITAAIASVNYSGGGMDTWVGNHRGDGAWWLHCYASSWNEVRVKGFRSANSHNDSWWGGNPLFSSNGGANKITVCIFGHVVYK